MTFISFLLLGIALTVIQIGAVYNKGTTYKEINQASRTINAELDRDVSNASSLTLATDYVITPATGTPAGGRLCLGSYSYIWNYAQAIDANNANVTKYLSQPDSTKAVSVIRLLKVPDPSKLYCAKVSTTSTALANPNIRVVDTKLAQEMLATGDHDLGVHQFAFQPVPASAINSTTGQQIYTLQYTIGTSQINALNATQSDCKAAGVPNADPLYCNVQQFSLVVRAGNGVN